MLSTRKAVSCLAVLLVIALAGFTEVGYGSEEILTIASDAHPISFDPTLTTVEMMSPYFDPVYDRLINQNPDGSLIPGLAIEWGYTEPLTFQLKLRRGVKFNNGEPFNAAAVVANFNRLSTPPSNAGFGAGQLARVTSCVAVDDYTVQYKLKSLDPSLANYFSQPPVGSIVSPKGISDAAKLAGEPSGIGPYTMNMDVTIPNQKYVYDKNPDYWNASAYPWKQIVVLEMLDNNARFNAIRSGQADIAMGTLADIKAAKTAGLNVNIPTSDLHGFVIMDHKGAVDKPLADVRVRKAMSYAIDREAFVKAILFGYGTPNSQFLANKSQVGSLPSLDNYYNYDPEKAKQLLAEAGYQDGFTFTALAEPFLQKEAEACAGFWSAIGITMKINVRVHDMVPQIKSLKFSSFFNTDTPLQPSQLVHFYLEGDILDVFNQDGTPELKSLYAAAMAATDPAQQQEAWGKVNRWLTENAWIIMFAVSGTPVFYHKGLEVDVYASQSEPRLCGIRSIK